MFNHHATCEECGGTLIVPDAPCIPCETEDYDEDDWLDLARALVLIPERERAGTLAQLVLTAILAAMFGIPL